MSPSSGYGHNDPFHKTYGSTAEDLQFTNNHGPAMPEVALGVVATPAAVDAAMSPTDQQIVKTLHGVVIWSYFLLLLLLLLYLAYKSWQILRRQKTPRARNDVPAE
jgi:hypothetical protein